MKKIVVLTGAGVSAAFAMLHSNVSASSTGTINKAADGVIIRASSVSGAFDSDEDAQARSDALLEYMSNSNKDQYGPEDLSETQKKELEGIKDKDQR